MKGPYERLKYELRRVWECPVCHHREKTLGTATSCVCRCQQKETALKRVCMKLVEDGARRKSPAVVTATRPPTASLPQPIQERPVDGEALVNPSPPSDATTLPLPAMEAHTPEAGSGAQEETGEK